MKTIQINVGGFDNNFSYLIIGENNSGILIDPTGDKEKILSVLKSNKIKLILQLITHAHPNHVELVKYFSEQGIKLKQFSQLLEKPVFEIMGLKIKTIFTPGHTKDSVCYLIENNLFTGDTLFVRGIGTTAYGGNPIEQKKSLELLSTLNPVIIVWPGHDYGGNSSSLGEALANSNIRPSKKTFEELRKKISDYESKLD